MGNCAAKGESLQIIAARGSWAASPNAIKADDADLELVQKLRRLHRQSLLKPRNDFDRACVLIASDRTIAIERYSAAFFHGLEIFGKRKLTFYTEGAAEVSYEEMWLVRLLRSLYSEDYSSVRYLMAMRVEAAGQRRLTFLAQGLAERLLA